MALPPEWEIDSCLSLLKRYHFTDALSFFKGAAYIIVFKEMAVIAYVIYLFGVKRSTTLTRSSS